MSDIVRIIERSNKRCSENRDSTVLKYYSFSRLEVDISVESFYLFKDRSERGFLILYTRRARGGQERT